MRDEGIRSGFAPSQRGAQALREEWEWADMARSLRPVRLAWDRLSNHLLAFTHCAAAGQTKVLVFVEANVSSAHEPRSSHNALKPYLLGLHPNLAAISAAS